MDGANRPLVSVIIPAHNAAATLDRCMRSVSTQSYRHMEIIVVDDGSTDGTAAIAEHHALSDSRISVIRQQTQGVARARNAAIEASKGQFIAPIDADDLWAVDKLEKQVQAFLTVGPSSHILVYCWSCTIDGDDNILEREPGSLAQGHVLGDLAVRNFIGNASAPLMVRAQVEAVGGYDESLQARGAQGCEDYRLYLRLAEIGTFAVVPEFLTGYRRGSGSMSAHSIQMLRSRDLCTGELAVRHPQLKADIRRGRSRSIGMAIRRSLTERQFVQAISLFMEIARSNPGYIPALVGEAVRRKWSGHDGVRAAATIFATGEGSAELAAR